MTRRVIIKVCPCEVQIDSRSILKHRGIAVLDLYNCPVTIVLTDGHPLPQTPHKVHLQLDEAIEFPGGFA